MQSTKSLTAQAYVVLCFLPRPNISEGPDRMFMGFLIDIETFFLETNCFGSQWAFKLISPYNESTIITKMLKIKMFSCFKTFRYCVYTANKSMLKYKQLMAF